MPEELAPEQLPYVDLEQENLKLGSQTIEDGFALELVKKDFFQYETYRNSNHDPRWNGNDALYLGYIPVRFWDGTKIPKASLSQPIAFSQIEAALPIIGQALFPSQDWFQVEPEPGADPREAREIADHLLYRLDHDRDELGRTAHREIDLAIKSILMYGNGGVQVYWDPTKKKPCIEWVDLRDIYVDAGTPTPDIDDSKSVIWRKHYTVEELDGMRGTPGMNIPPRPVLNYMSKRYTAAPADRTKTMQEAFRGVNWVPGASDYSMNPAARGIEVLIYYSKGRIIWVLNREWVAFNGPNPYGFTPFCFAPCFTVLSRFYAMSYPDVLEGQQRYIEALYNARLNELALSINPPRVKKLGGTSTPNMDRWAPGMIMSVNDPKNDLAVQFPQNATANIMGDIEFLTQTTQIITGVNGAAQGNFAPGNVNRTATGISAQTSGANSRLFYIIKNIEDYLIVPMLYKLYRLIQFYSDVNDILPALGPDAQQIQVGAKAFHAPVRFKMVAASQMLTRDKLMGILPFLTQYYLNGSFVQQLHAVGKTVDFDEFQKALQDATGTGRIYHFIRPMTPQEQQQVNQPPAQVVMQQQQKQQELQTRMQIAQQKNQTDLQLKQMDKEPNIAEIQQQQAEMQLDAQQQQQELALELQKHRMEMAQRQDEMRQKAAQAQQDMFLKALSGANDLQLQRQQAIQQAQSHQQELAQSNESHKAVLAQGQDKHRATQRQSDEKHKAGLKQSQASAKQEMELRALQAQEQMNAPQSDSE